MRHRAAALLTLAACNGVAIAHYLGDPAYQRDDYRAAAAYLRAHDAADAAVIVLWGRPELLAYYGAPGAVDGTAFGRAISRRASTRPSARARRRRW
ncbi:MAG: hypothetical protein U0802_22795 [Candidatus Binatia bacterium]